MSKYPNTPPVKKKNKKKKKKKQKHKNCASLDRLNVPGLLPSLNDAAKSVPVPRNRSRSTGRNSKSRKKYGKGKYKRNYSLTPKTKYSKYANKNKPSNKPVDKKLGPVAIGKNKYKGTKSSKHKHHGSFLDPKITSHARSSSFLQRKLANPIKKKQTVEEIGTPNGWVKPDYVNDVIDQLLQNNDWLQDKPMAIRDNKLDALKDAHIPKGQSVSSYGTPNVWAPIEYEYDNNGGDFLNEKLWFEGSAVQIDSGLAKIIEALPPRKKMELNNIPSPTGYQTKINFLKKLREIVMEEVRALHREERLLEMLQKDTKTKSVKSFVTTPKILNVVKEDIIDDDCVIVDDLINTIDKLKLQSDDSDDDNDDDDNKSPKNDIDNIKVVKKSVKKNGNINKNMNQNDDIKADLDMKNDIDVVVTPKKKRKRVTFGITAKTSFGDDDVKKSDNNVSPKKHSPKNSLALDPIEDDCDYDFNLSDDDDDDKKDDNKDNMKIKSLLKRKNSKHGLFRRKLLTMKSINQLNDMIDDLEDQQLDVQ